MRYSLYIHLNQMCQTLLEAAEYLQNHIDSLDAAELVNNSKSMLDLIGRNLCKNKDSVKSEELFAVLKNSMEYLNSAGEQEALQNYFFSITRLSQLMLNDILYQIRVVFLAELGEKWDSLKSIYEAFQLRPECENMIVRTPIFRAIKKNGKITQDVIYKDFLTPMGVPSIDYKKYNMKKHRPDVVFLSQPYESCTLPQFWPENISKYSRLVSLPYFTRLNYPTDELKDYYRLPVFSYAWRHIHQSEQVAEVEHRRYFVDRERMLITGLPKWDDIVNDLKDSTNTVAPWAKNLKGKKTFLWMTHYNYTSWFNYGEELLNYFQERDDIALIWRPHPMTKTALKLYNPQLKAIFERITAAMAKADNMEIDWRPSYIDSFSVADAGICEFSSMMPQFLIADKPLAYLRPRSAEPLEFIWTVPWMEDIFMEDSLHLTGVNSFIESVCSGKDRKVAQRKQVLATDMALADGHSGERICAAVIKEMMEEDGIFELPE